MSAAPTPCSHQYEMWESGKSGDTMSLYAINVDNEILMYVFRQYGYPSLSGIPTSSPDSSPTSDLAIVTAAAQNIMNLLGQYKDNG